MSYQVLIPKVMTEVGRQYLLDHDCIPVEREDATVETLCRQVVGADALLVRTEPCPRSVFEAADRLKVVAKYGAGVDNIDLEAATEHGVQVCNAPTANSNSVAEHTIMLLLACAKNLLIQDAACRRGDFDARNRHRAAEVEGRTLGLIGCGYIGRLVAKKAALGLGMRVVGYDAYARIDQMPEYITLLPTPEAVYQCADFISLHVPLTSETRDLVDAAALSRMKPTAVLLNCARGGIVNEPALYGAVRDGVIAGAGLDVFCEEPINPDNPLYTLDRVVVTPHSAALSHEAFDRMSLETARDMVAVLTGAVPEHPVNRL